jgi:2-iminoacetate synthase
MFYDEYLKLDRASMGKAVLSEELAKASGAVAREDLRFEDFLSLLAPAAAGLLDQMALRSRAITQKHFGKNIGMYIPLYLSNECTNECVYCGFNRNNDINRRTLTEHELDQELAAIKQQGYDSILLLTGEAPARVGLGTIARCVTRARELFTQVSLEIYPMDTDGYKRLVDSGATGLTVYQETYNRETYSRVHRSGRKAHFQWRLEAPDRAALAGFRKIGIGALLGLSDWRVDAAHVGAHAAYLMRKYWRTEVSVSFPRMRECPSTFKPACIVTDRELVQMMFALRLYLKSAGIALSTRESQGFRDNMIDLGVTSMSAGSKTNPGGYETYSKSESQGQFEICDDRNTEQVVAAIRGKGYCPVFKDWSATFGGVRP